jgi:hypothetical protein
MDVDKGWFRADIAGRFWFFQVEKWRAIPRQEPAVHLIVAHPEGRRSTAVSDSDNPRLPTWALPTLSWVVSAYFFIVFFKNAGFLPGHALVVEDALYGGFALLFLFFPFFSKVKIGSLLELERQIAKTQEELRDFKTEIRSSISVRNTNVVTIGFPKGEKQEVDAHVSPEVKQQVQQFEESLETTVEEPARAIKGVWQEVGSLLRSILRKRTPAGTLQEFSILFSDVPELWKQFRRDHPQYHYLDRSFDYLTAAWTVVTRNEALRDAEAQEALSLGARIVAVLSKEAGRSDVQRAAPADR